GQTAVTHQPTARGFDDRGDRPCLLPPAPFTHPRHHVVDNHEVRGLDRGAVAVPTGPERALMEAHSVPDRDTDRAPARTLACFCRCADVSDEHFSVVAWCA